jgi:membrane-bound lytic murein transglycosylase D
MTRLAAPLTVALCLSLLPAPAVAQSPQNSVKIVPTAASRAGDPQTQMVIDRAQHLYSMGEEAFAQGDLDRSRRSFDDAIDAILTSGLDVRSNDALHTFYKDLVERVHRHQMLAQDADGGGFAEQAYVPAESELAGVSDADLASLGGPADESIDGVYNFQFTTGAPVYQFINYFTKGRGRGTMESGLRRSGRYRRMAERIFKEEGVPTDLIWLAQVESVWKPAALSHAAAKGIWQFIPSTGRRFGLDQDYYVDERSHPEESTRAAARYLKFLYNYFGGDWLLAMAAYNSGEGNVSKGIARSGYADFWEIHRLGYLPTETRNSVPAILAVVIIAHNQERYGFNVTPEPELVYDLAQVNSQTDLGVIAALCGTSPDYIRDLNPHFRRDVTPPGTVAIRLPSGKKSTFETAWAGLSPEARLGRQSASQPDAELAVDRSSDRYAARPVRATSGFGGGNSTTSYSVKPGESLTSIASRHGLSAVELARVNSMSANTKVKTGQVLKVPAKKADFKERNSRKSSYRAKPEPKSKSQASKKSAPAKKAPAKRSRRN